MHFSCLSTVGTFPLTLKKKSCASTQPSILLCTEHTIYIRTLGIPNPKSKSLYSITTRVQKSTTNEINNNNNGSRRATKIHYLDIFMNVQFFFQTINKQNPNFIPYGRT